MSQGVFVTGTDTGVGKTLVASALLRAARARGLRSVGMKPVAAGTDPSGCQEDVEALIDSGNLSADRRLINPYCFQAPIAPHLAAAESSTLIESDVILKAYQALSGRADYVVVEGAGGLLVPLGAGLDTSDIAARIGLPLLVVVGIRLGCINHALLTIEAIARRNLPIAGWVANCVDPTMSRVGENIEALAERIDAPLVATLPWGISPDKAGIALQAQISVIPNPLPKGLEPSR